MKLEAITAPSNSVTRLPSRYPNTTPQIIPNGSPFKNMKKMLYGAGTNAKNKRLNQAVPINNTSMRGRSLYPNSDTNRTPKNFDSVYPINCAITSRIL